MSYRHFKHSVQKNILTALSFFIAALSFGQNVEELNKKSNGFILKDDFRSAFPLVKKAAEKGNAEAQCNYGIFFQKGIVVPRNDSIALYWFLKSANQNWAKGQLHVAVCYMESPFLKPDFNKAFEWIQKCANQGEPECMWSLSGGYESGMGIKENMDSMLYWQTEVAKLQVSKIENDDKYIIVQARVNLAEWYRVGYKKIEKNNVKSYMWFLLYNEDKKYLLGLSSEENQKAQKKQMEAITELAKELTNEEKQNAIKSTATILQHRLRNLDKLNTVDK
jgi:TPR repeat protein